MLNRFVKMNLRTTDKTKQPVYERKLLTLDMIDGPDCLCRNSDLQRTLVYGKQGYQRWNKQANMRADCHIGHTDIHTFILYIYSTYIYMYIYFSLKPVSKLSSVENSLKFERASCNCHNFFEVRSFHTIINRRVCACSSINCNMNLYSFFLNVYKNVNAV